MEQVRVCRFCGYIEAAPGSQRCDNCEAFSGMISVPRAEAERLSRSRRFGFLRSRLLIPGIALAFTALLAFWVSWNYLGLAPNPPAASTDVAPTRDPGDWPQARRTGEGTGFTPNPVPYPHEIKWSYSSGGPLLNSPAVAGDLVYLTTETGKLVALDRTTGLPVWEHITGFPSSSTPAVAGRLVVYAIRPGRILAVDAITGALQWERDMGSPILASPVVRDGTVYIGVGDHKLYALDIASGAVLWSFTTDDWVISAVCLADNALVVVSKDNLLHVVDTNTGRRRLVYDTGRARQILGGPATQADRVYVGSQKGRVWAINWRERSLPWDRFVLFWKTTFYVWGWLLDPPSQRGSVWGAQVEGDVAQSPAVDGGRIYVASVSGVVSALGASSGEVLWETDMGSPVTAAPTVAGPTVLVGTESGMVAGLDALNGQLSWGFETGGKITGSPVVAATTLYVVSHDGNLYALEAVP